MGRFRALGAALVELVRAELAAILEELQRSARELQRGAVLLAVAAFFGFWTIGALAFAAVEAAALWLPRWGAALAVAGLFALVVLVLLLVARAHLRKVESPARVVGRRLEGHGAWVQDELLGEGDRE